MTPFAVTSWTGIAEMTSPSSRISPDLGCRRPEIVFSVVDFPAPFAPIRVTISPRWTSTLIPLSASIAP